MTFAIILLAPFAQTIVVMYLTKKTFSDASIFLIPGSVAHILTKMIEPGVAVHSAFMVH